MSCISDIFSSSVCKKEDGELFSPCVKATTVALSALLLLAGVFALLQAYGILNIGIGLGTIGSTGSYLMMGFGLAGILIALDYSKRIITGQTLRAESRYIWVKVAQKDGTGSIEEGRLLRDRLSSVDEVPIASFLSGFVRLVASIVHAITYVTLAALSKAKQEERLKEVSLAGRNFVQAVCAMIPFVGNLILYFKNSWNIEHETDQMPALQTQGVATLYEFGKEVRSVDGKLYLETLGRNPSDEELLELFRSAVFSEDQKYRFGGFSTKVDVREIAGQTVDEKTFKNAIAHELQ